MLVNMERRCLAFASEILNLALKHRVQIVTKCIQSTLNKITIMEYESVLKRNAVSYT